MINSMDPHELADYAMSKLPDAITLGEFKFMKLDFEYISTKNDIVTGVNRGISKGFGIRILKNGAWGFSASNIISKESVNTVISQAIKLADAATIRNPNVVLTEEPVINDKVSTDYKINPFEVEIDEKIAILIESGKIANAFDEIKFANGLYVASEVDMIFYNNEGTKIDQKVVYNGGQQNLVGIADGDVQTRKFPDDSFATLGFEYFKSLNIVDNIEQQTKELIDLLKAPQMKSGVSTIILNPSQLGLQLHESCGHPSELDRAMKYEAAYAGTSFLETKLLQENFKYGNELVSINADATIPGAIGSFPYDHEGVAGKKTNLVVDGIFTDYLSSRETASLIGLKHSSGSMRSSGYDKIPLIRMTNIIFQPKKDGLSLDEMITDTKDGYYLHTNRSWSIDDRRLNFQFGCEIGYKIEKGEIVGKVKNPTYTGITPEFWNSVSAVGIEKEVEILGTLFCGKGEPGQSMFTGHGGPPVRFDNIRIGVME
jgi:TldD protein